VTTTFTLSRQGSIATLTLHRPEMYNALRPADLVALRRAISSLPPDVRALVITGEGGAFCAGAEVPPGATRRVYWSMLAKWAALVRSLRRGPFVTIAAVNGLAVCGGFELILACDFVVVARDAHVLDQHVKFGLHPGAASTVRLPTAIGQQRALWHLLGAEPLTGARMVELGLALESCEPAELLARAYAIAAVFDDRVPATVASVKACVQRYRSRWAPLLERVACLRNTRRLGSRGTEVRVQRFEENSAIVTAVEAERTPAGSLRP
jgi:enoyl-CoA hydratase/carnithine racemase